MKKGILTKIVLIILSLLALVGCGKHEHSFSYVVNNDGTHVIECLDEKCEYSENEACQYSSDYVCEICGYKHEHTFTYTSKEDGTHNKVCAECGLDENVGCVLNEEYVCSECGWTHEHILTYEPAGEAIHNAVCSIECCHYVNTEVCVNDDYLCATCGYEFPKWTVETRDARTYYARKELNVYKEPYKDSEVVKTLAVDDSIVCVGVVKQYKDEAVWFYQTDEGFFVEQERRPKCQGLKNLNPAKSNQVYIFDDFYDGYDKVKSEGVYNSVDEALIAISGHDRDWFRANWERRTDMWGRVMYTSPMILVEYREHPDGYTYPHYTSHGSIYLEDNGSVLTYTYKDVSYRFDY